LNVIRALKYWKQEKNIKIGSYLLETMVLYYYENSDRTCGSYVDIELEQIFPYLANNIMNNVIDPKNIQLDINDIDYADRFLLKEKFNKFSQLTNEARQFERDKNIEKSINKWKEIFGDNFPSYK